MTFIALTVVLVVKHVLSVLFPNVADTSTAGNTKLLLIDSENDQARPFADVKAEIMAKLQEPKAQNAIQQYAFSSEDRTIRGLSIWPPAYPIGI